MQIKNKLYFIIHIYANNTSASECRYYQAYYWLKKKYKNDYNITIITTTIVDYTHTNM